MAESERLVDSQIKRARPRAKVYTLLDGRGLQVIVHPNGSKYFQFRYSFAGKPRLMQLGRWPELTLKQAREKAMEYRKALRERHEDPITSRRLGKLQKIAEAAASFAFVASDWLKHQRPQWSQRNYERHESLLRLHLLPTLAPLPVSAIKVTALVSLVQSIERKGTLHTARQAARTLQAVFDRAVVLGMLSESPADTAQSIVRSAGTRASCSSAAQ